MVLVFLNDFLSNEGGFSVQIATAVVFSFAVGAHIAIGVFLMKILQLLASSTSMDFSLVFIISM